jgi:hypothetical protein
MSFVRYLGKLIHSTVMGADPYRSREVRWFFTQRQPTIENWFTDHGHSFDETKPRTDFYLATQTDDLGIKLREGNIEIKQRQSKGHPLSFTPKANGMREQWTKWSFMVNSHDPLAKSIIQLNQYDWIPVEKWRLAVKINQKPDGLLEILDIAALIKGGCQIEYTRIKIQGREWFTFGLEAFGNNDINGNQPIDAIIGGSSLPLAHSMGYPAFFNHRLSS